MRKLLAIMALLTAVGLFYAPRLPSAAAAGVSAPVADCSAHGYLKGHYSASELRNALATMPADVQAYTNCPDVIRRALLAELGAVGGGGSGGGGSSFLPGWVIAVIVVLVVAGAAMAGIAVRNRRRTS